MTTHNFVRAAWISGMPVEWRVRQTISPTGKEVWGEWADVKTRQMPVYPCDYEQYRIKPTEDKHEHL